MRPICLLSLATISLLPTVRGRHLPPSKPTSTAAAVATAAQASLTSHPTLAIPDVALNRTHVSGAAEHTDQDFVMSNEESITVEMEKHKISSQKEVEVGDELVSERNAGVEAEAEPTPAERKEKRDRCWLLVVRGGHGGALSE